MNHCAFGITYQHAVSFCITLKNAFKETPKKIINKLPFVTYCSCMAIWELGIKHVISGLQAKLPIHYTKAAP